MERSSAPASPGFKLAIMPVTPFQQNCTLLWDPTTMQGAIVDPGGDLDVIEDGIRQVGAKIEKIILTHGHMDHAGGATELKEKLGGVPIEGPNIADKFLLDTLATQGAKYDLGSRDLTPDRWLAEGETVTIAGEAFDIYHCPGHSPGSVVLVNAQRRFALVGDVLFRGSIGRTDFPYGDHEALISAIHTKLLPLGDDIQFICGHGPPSTFGRERATNPFLT